VTQVYENSAKKKLRAGELVLCMAVNQLRSAEAPMIAARCGFDAIFLDLEHSATSLETAASICVGALTAGITPIARVPSHNPFHAARILDTGAQGVMLPHVEKCGRGARDREEPALSADGHALRVQHRPDPRVSRARPRGDQHVSSTSRSS
jgi:2-keto-3-deoxy-L-rhamnonate aldolase RhmA